MPSPLPNHLLAHRKRAALSQEDMAFLLGTRGGSKVSRYERFKRDPNLETVLVYEAIFGKPASQLFTGQYRNVEKRLAERVKVLIHRTKRQKQGSAAKRKLEVLTALLARLSE
jgi:transcriptional regulator with XRE-family HTH domain